MALRAYADGSVFAEVLGSSPPRILALHGWARRGADFIPALTGLDAVALDLPGFGASPIPPEALGARDYAAVVSDLLGEFETAPVVVGHSFGGRVAVCLAAAHPEQVGSLILTGVPLVRLSPPGKPGLAYRTARLLNRLNLISDERLELEKRRRGSADYRAATGTMRDILVKAVSESYEEELRTLRSPVRLLWGAQDREVPLEVADIAGRILREAGVEVELTVIEGAGHMVPSEAPDALRAAIVRELSG